MFNLTEILQKELHENDQTVGIAEGLLFDNLTRGCLLKTEGEILEVDKIAPRWDGVKVNARTWQNEQVTALYDKAQFVRELAVGQKIVDQNGMDLGEVADVELTAKLAIKRVLTTGGRYLSRGEVIAVGDVVIAKAKLYKRVVAEEVRRERVLEKLSESKTAASVSENGTNETVDDTTIPKTMERANDIDAESVNDADKTKDDASAEKDNAADAQESAAARDESNTKHENATAAEKEKTMPLVAISDKSIRRRYGDFSFLIGKSVDKTVVNFQGEVMIRQHETITRDILRQAKISGKLLELYLHIE